MDKRHSSEFGIITCFLSTKNTVLSTKLITVFFVDKRHTYYYTKGTEQWPFLWIKGTGLSNTKLITCFLWIKGTVLSLVLLRVFLWIKGTRVNLVLLRVICG